MKPVIVFKTSVTTTAAANGLKPLLDALIRQDERWNFDLQDRDHILRVESITCDAGQVIGVLNVAGYDCEELQ